MLSSDTSVASPKVRRRQSALVSLANKRASIAPTVVNLNCLVKVYLLDGSSKVLQMFDNSTAKDVLVSLRLNLDLHDISTFALFRVVESNVRRIDLHERISDVLVDTTGFGKSVSLLFRSWIHYKNGVFYNDVFQNDVRYPVANTALWLYYSEALFMCFSGKYYLNEDEALFLGCLRAQVESGDFMALRHTVAAMKSRIMLRFPEPVCSRMKLFISTDQPAADALSEKAQAVHARLIGRDKTTAQIEFLRFLETWSPFFGCTFYRVQCQYDSKPLDSSASSNPPVVGMTAAVGPAAILLLTSSESTILRHPYQRIIKWIAHSDKHIFTYWVIKPEVRLSDIEQYQESSSARNQFDPRPYCDCVYLVTPQVKELEHLVKSYVQSAVSAYVAPSLPGVPEELRAPNEPDYEELYNKLKESVDNSSSSGGKKKGATAAVGLNSSSSGSGSSGRRPSSSPAKVSRLSIFLSALGGGTGITAPLATEEEEDEVEEVVSGSGMALYSESEEQQQHQGEVGAVLSSLFKNMYVAPDKGGKSGQAEDQDVSLGRIPTSVRYASTLAELQKVASEEQFSDNESEDEPSSEEGPEEKKEEVNEESDNEQGTTANKGEVVQRKRRDSAIARASRAFFKVVKGAAGGGGEGDRTAIGVDDNDEPEDEEEE